MSGAYNSKIQAALKKIDRVLTYVAEDIGEGAHQFQASSTDSLKELRSQLGSLIDSADAVSVYEALEKVDQELERLLADAKDGLKLADSGNAGNTETDNKDDSDKDNSDKDNSAADNDDKENSGSQNGGTTAPKTGDSAPIGLWVSLAGVAMFMAALLTGEKRKNNQ